MLSVALCTTVHPTIPFVIGTRIGGIPSATFDQSSFFSRSMSHSVARSLCTSSCAALTASAKSASPFDRRAASCSFFLATAAADGPPRDSGAFGVAFVFDGGALPSLLEANKALRLSV